MQFEGEARTGPGAGAPGADRGCVAKFHLANSRRDKQNQRFYSVYLGHARDARAHDKSSAQLGAVLGPHVRAARGNANVDN